MMIDEAATPSEISILVVEGGLIGSRSAKTAIRDGAREEGAEQTTVVVKSVKRALSELDSRRSRFDAVVLAIKLNPQQLNDTLNAINATNMNVAVLAVVEDFVVGPAIAALRSGATGIAQHGDIDDSSLWRGLRLAIERKRNESELYTLTQTDPLTGLSNRRAFTIALDRAVEQGQRSAQCFAVLIIDLNNFKTVNDVYGHTVGDGLLKHIAKCLSGVLRRTDVVARLGGDEFAVIASNLKTTDDALEIADKIKESVECEDAIEGVSLIPSVSIGISIYTTPEEDAEALVTQADMAMYKSKRDPNHAVFYYDEKMHRDATSRHDIKKSLTTCALAENLYLDFQPIVAADSTAIVGVEGLARWKDKKDKIIAPSEFIPIAEECGWISKLGTQLIDEACRFMQELDDCGIPAIPISMNVSPIQCREPSFALELTSALLKYGVAPSKVAIEITETALMQNIEVARRTLEMLQDAGIDIHIDDFGTGYSSLALLKELPLNRLKIDRKFVSDITNCDDDRRIVEAIVELGIKLGFEVVAEGVETQAQADVLRDIGVQYMQGFFFSRPISGRRLKEMLAVKKPVAGTYAPERGRNGVRMPAARH